MIFIDSKDLIVWFTLYQTIKEIPNSHQSNIL